MVDPAVRRLLALAVHHPSALVTAWEALALTDEQSAALLPEAVQVAIGGLTTGATVEQVAARLPSLAPLLRWYVEPWPPGCYPPPRPGELDELVSGYARRRAAALADACDLMGEGIPEALALRAGEAAACRALAEAGA